MTKIRAWPAPYCGHARPGYGRPEALVCRIPANRLDSHRESVTAFAQQRSSDTQNAELPIPKSRLPTREYQPARRSDMGSDMKKQPKGRPGCAAVGCKRCFFRCRSSFFCSSEPRPMARVVSADGWPSVPEHDGGRCRTRECLALIAKTSLSAGRCAAPSFGSGNTLHWPAAPAATC